MRRLAIFLGVALFGLFGPVFLVAAAGGDGWVGATEEANLSNNADSRQAALALGANEISAAWAGDPGTGKAGDQGIFLRRWARTSPVQSATPSTLTQGIEAWNPSLAYSGTQLLAVWVQGDYDTPVGTVVQQDIGQGVTKTVIGPIYGFVSPRLAVAANGYHLGFSGSTDGRPTQGDLYHVYRPAGSTSWNPPVMVVTRTQVVPDASSGGIWYPGMAVSADGQRVHLVWEQGSNKVVSPTTVVSYTIWYVEGLWAGDHYSWGTPVQLSPTGQQATRPSVGTDAQGRVHVLWTELIVGSGGVTNPEAQYINYRQRLDGVWSSARRIDPEPVRVNTYRPGRASSSFAVTGNRICAVWHGFRGAVGEAGQEDIFMVCSLDGGASWQPPVNVSGTRTLSFFPMMQMDNSEQIYLVWEEFQGTGTFTTDYDIFYRSGRIVYHLALPIVLKGAR